MPSVKNMLMAAAGEAGGDALNVENVFSTYLYEGTDANQTITNGVDLSGEGGLVWIKGRNQAYNNLLFDTERGVNKFLASNSAAAEATYANQLTSFNADGFSLGQDNIFAEVNNSYGSYASWTFRKAPKFFDIVTYTGNGTAGRTISHNLGTTVGSVW